MLMYATNVFAYMQIILHFYDVRSYVHLIICIYIGRNVKLNNLIKLREKAHKSIRCQCVRRTQINRHEWDAVDSREKNVLSATSCGAVRASRSPSTLLFLVHLLLVVTGHGYRWHCGLAMRTGTPFHIHSDSVLIIIVIIAIRIFVAND